LPVGDGDTVLPQAAIMTRGQNFLNLCNAQ
jgi:hypothetical protein